MQQLTWLREVLLFAIKAIASTLAQIICCLLQMQNNIMHGALANKNNKFNIKLCHIYI